MDSINGTKNYNVDRNCRTLWVGNLHPKVSNAIIAELFYQVGPIECIEFAYDEHGVSENFACIVFKYQSSVEDSIKLLQGTKLYGLEIITKKYSEELRDPVFDDQLNYFKQFVNIERRNQTYTGNKRRWNDQNKANQHIIPQTLPEPPFHGKYNLMHDGYNGKSETMPRNSYRDESSKYHHGNSYNKNRNPDYGNEYQPIDKFHQNRGHYRGSDHNSRSSSMVANHDRSSYRTQSYDRKYQQDYGSMRNESNYYNQEQLNPSEHVSVKGELPVRDLRDTIHRRRNVSDSEYQNDQNANSACTSTLDLRDTMYHGKINRYNDLQSSYQLEPKSRWSERKKNVQGGGGYSSKSYHNDNYSSERHDEFNTKQFNHYSNQEYNVQSFSHDKPYNSFQDRNKEYSNNIDGGYNREKNRPNHLKYNEPRRENVEFKNRQHNPHHPYKRSDDSNDKKEYKNIHNNRNEQSGHGRGRSYKGGFDKMHNNYS